MIVVGRRAARAPGLGLFFLALAVRQYGLLGGLDDLFALGWGVLFYFRHYDGWFSPSDQTMAGSLLPIKLWQLWGPEELRLPPLARCQLWAAFAALWTSFFLLLVR